MSKKKLINLSPMARESLGIEPDIEITEELLQLTCNEMMDISKNISKLSLDIKEEDVQILSDYLDSRKFHILINGKKKIFDNDFIDSVNNSNSKTVPITITQLVTLYQKLDLKDKNLNLHISQNEIQSFSDNDLEKILSSYNIKRCDFHIDNISTFKSEAISSIPNLKVYFKDCRYPEKNLEIVDSLCEKIKQLTQNIKQSDNEFDKFSIIYRRLAESITYDYFASDLIKKERNGIELSADEKSKIASSQNLEGLLTQTTVCAGYSRILQCALNSVGIECKYISGETDSERDFEHSWNQVKIDGKWYNADLTWDRDNIIAGNSLKYCLRSDAEFQNHRITSFDYEVCNKSYEQEKIQNIFNINELEVEQGDYSIEQLMNLIHKLREQSHSGLRIGISEDFDKGGYEIGFGNVVSQDGVKWSDTQVHVNDENISEFIKLYARKYTIIKNDNNTPFVESSEGVGLSIITNKLQQQLSQDGIDMNEILKPTLSEKYAGYITGKVATMNKKNSHSMDLVEYKTSILSKLLSSIRNKLIGLQDKIFNRKLDNHKTEKAITAKSEKLPSWDLKNWSSEELEAYATWAKQQQTIKENLVEKEDDLYFKL